MRPHDQDRPDEFRSQRRSNQAVLLVAHGSPDPRSAPVVRALAERCGAHASFLEFDQPHPLTALRELADQGHLSATLVPLLLTNAYHARIDVPRIAAEASGFIDIHQATPVGTLSHARSLVVGLPDCDGVVVGAAGTRVAAGRSHIHAVAAETGRLLGVPALAGFATGEGLRPAEAVRQLRAQGARRVAAVSYFIAPGKLSDVAMHSAREGGAIFVGQPLGVSESGSSSISAAIGRRVSTPRASLVGATTSKTV
ncbi:sirohydrochlorin chelatase [Natronoglycomyces albus]|uniref:Sirohydrochlorin chelatase n=1 Tax=Natronoglycomyces albus TaxID=2811108 RepID=A0A895XS32_9ACTN|nr:CbiX/SirB N-terminal domain-containing protein [Natronoglycomyces albus]QSB04438.1 hypothetical protein JQS30_11640 [Natronoglycomyces albus]